MLGKKVYNISQALPMQQPMQLVLFFVKMPKTLWRYMEILDTQKIFLPFHLEHTFEK